MNWGGANKMMSMELNLDYRPMYSAQYFGNCFNLFAMILIVSAPVRSTDPTFCICSVCVCV